MTRTEARTADSGVLRPRARERRLVPEARRGEEGVHSPPGPREVTVVLPTLGLEPRKINLEVWSPKL